MPPEHDTQTVEENREYATLTLENDEVVIYDTDNRFAWIQSDTAIALDDL